jgi:hypothetical protein
METGAQAIARSQERFIIQGRELVFAGEGADPGSLIVIGDQAERNRWIVGAQAVQKRHYGLKETVVR